MTGSTHIQLLAQDVPESRFRPGQAAADRTTGDLAAYIAALAPNPILAADRQGRALYVNESFSAAFGYTLEDLKDGGAGALFGPAETEIVHQVRGAYQRSSSFQFEAITYSKTGQRAWMSCTVSLVNGFTENESLPRMGNAPSQINGDLNVSAGNELDSPLTAYLLVFTDISAVKLNETILELALEAMARDRPASEIFTIISREVERISPDVTVCVIEADPDKNLKPLACPSLPDVCVKAACSLAAGRSASPSGRAVQSGEPAHTFNFNDDETMDKNTRRDFVKAGYAAGWATPIKSGAEILGTVAFYYREPTEPDDFQKKMGEIMAHICAVALERERARESMHRLAYYDELTGLPNRSLFIVSAGRLLKAAVKNGRHLAVILISIDQMKTINEGLGHKQGDVILKSIAKALHDQWCGSPCFLGRMSGNDLGLVLADCDAESAVKAAGAIGETVARPIEIDGVTVTPTASLGISLYPTNGSDIEGLVHNASLALNNSAKIGPARFSFFCCEQTEQARLTLAMESALRKAIGGPELKVYYQPQINLADGRLHGVEALTRWVSPVFGQVPPNRFIPMMENAGLAGQFFRWLIGQATRSLALWRRKGLNVPAVSVNLSGSNFKEPNLLKTIMNALDDNGLKPCDLVLELTESFFMNPDSQTMHLFDGARKAGIKFSIDDFGTGYSCLSYLHYLPLSELKLDRSFVANFEDNQASRDISQAIKRLGESLGLTLVAEGVETKDQHRLLGEQGWHAAQGYLFAPALPEDAFERWIRTRPGVEGDNYGSAGNCRASSGSHQPSQSGCL